MSQDQYIDIPDVLNLEFELQKRINELTYKTKALEDSHRELLQVHQQLLNQEIELESQKRTLVDLRMQLKSAHQVIELLQKEKSKCTNETIQLQIKCDAAVNERESLLQQAHAAKLENMTLRMNAHKLTETAAANEAAKKTLEASLLEAQERFSSVHGTLQSNIAKLEQEHQHLLKSVESTTQLNKRLQTVGLCTYAIYAKKNEEIKKLQEELVLKSHSNTVEPQVHFTSTNSGKLNAKEILEQVKMNVDKDSETDKEVEALLLEYENF